MLLLYSYTSTYTENNYMYMCTIEIFISFKQPCQSTAMVVKEI